MTMHNYIRYRLTLRPEDFGNIYPGLYRNKRKNKATKDPEVDIFALNSNLPDILNVINKHLDRVKHLGLFGDFPDLPNSSPLWKIHEGTGDPYYDTYLNIFAPHNLLLNSIDRFMPRMLGDTLSYMLHHRIHGYQTNSNSKEFKPSNTSFRTPLLDFIEDNPSAFHPNSIRPMIRDYFIKKYKELGPADRIEDKFNDVNQNPTEKLLGDTILYSSDVLNGKIPKTEIGDLPKYPKYRNTQIRK